MKKHNARRKKVQARKAKQSSQKSRPNIGHPMSGFITPEQGRANYNALNRTLFHAQMSGEIAFFEKSEVFVSPKEIPEEDYKCIEQGILTSRILGEGEEALGTAMNPVFNHYEDDPYWNIGSMGSIWMDIKTDAGTEYRISAIDVGEKVLVMGIQDQTPESVANRFKMQFGEFSN